MLSSFAYGRIKVFSLPRGYREGVEVREVNPAFAGCPKSRTGSWQAGFPEWVLGVAPVFQLSRQLSCIRP